MSQIDKLIADLCPEGVEFRTLKSLARRSKGTSITAARMKALSRPSGEIRVFAGGKTFADVDASAIPSGDVITTPSIIVRSRGNIDFTYYDKPFSHKSEIWSYSTSQPDVEQRFIYYYLTTLTSHLQEVARATSVKLPQLAVKDTDLLRIPVPPLEVQREIVRVLDKFTQLEAELEAELEARHHQYKYYQKTLLTPADKSYHTASLGELFELRAGKFISATLITPKRDAEHPIPCFGGGGLRGYVSSHNQNGDLVLIGRQGALCGNVKRASGKFYATEHAVVVSPKSAVDIRWAFHLLSHMNLNQYASKSAQPGLSVNMLKQLSVPVPPLPVQVATASILDKFDSLVNDLSIGLPAELAARRKQYEYYRDRLLTFEEKR